MNKQLKQLIVEYNQFMDDILDYEEGESIATDVVNDNVKRAISDLEGVKYNKSKYNKDIDYNKVKMYTDIGYYICSFFDECKRNETSKYNTYRPDIYFFECVFDSDKHYGGPDHCYVYGMVSYNQWAPIIDIILDSANHIKTLYISHHQSCPLVAMYLNKYDDIKSKVTIEFTLVPFLTYLDKHNITIDEICIGASPSSLYEGQAKNPIDSINFSGDYKTEHTITSQFVKKFPLLTYDSSERFKDIKPLFNNKNVLYFRNELTIESDDVFREFLSMFMEKQGCKSIRMVNAIGLKSSSLVDERQKAYSDSHIILIDELHKHKCSEHLNKQERQDRVGTATTLYMVKQFPNFNIDYSYMTSFSNDDYIKKELNSISGKDEQGKYKYVIIRVEWWKQYSLRSNRYEPHHHTKIAWKIYDSGVCEIGKLYFTDRYVNDDGQLIEDGEIVSN